MIRTVMTNKLSASCSLIPFPRLGFWLDFSLDAEAWASPVMPKHHHEDRIVVDFIQEMIWKSLHVSPP